MAIENEFKFRGLAAASGYSRARRTTLDHYTGAITVEVDDWADAAAATKVDEPVTHYVPEEYDPENPDHVRQRAELEKSGPDALAPNEKGEPWSPTRKEVRMKWRGQFAEPPLQSRTIELSIEQALQVIQLAVPGGNPAGAIDDLRSQLYRTLMASGHFSKAKAV